MIRIIEKIHRFNNIDELSNALDSGKIGEFDYTLIEDEDSFNMDGYCKAKTYQTALKKLYKSAISAGANPNALNLDDMIFNIDMAIRKHKIYVKQHSQDNSISLSSKDRYSDDYSRTSEGMDDYGYENFWYQKDPTTGTVYYFRLNLMPVDDNIFYVDIGYSKKNN